MVMSRQHRRRDVRVRLVRQHDADGRLLGTRTHVDQVRVDDRVADAVEIDVHRRVVVHDVARVAAVLRVGVQRDAFRAAAVDLVVLDDGAVRILARHAALELRAGDVAVTREVERHRAAGADRGAVDDIAAVGLVELDAGVAVLHGQAAEGHVRRLARLQHEAGCPAPVDDGARTGSRADHGAPSGARWHVPEVHRLVVGPALDPDGVTRLQHRLDGVDGLERLGLAAVATRRGGLVDPPLGCLCVRARRKSDQHCRHPENPQLHWPRVAERSAFR